MSETLEAKKRADADLLEFVIRWAWRDSPISDTERLSAIMYHPTLRQRAIEAGYVNAAREDGRRSPLPTPSQAFDDWFYAVEGFGLRAERFDGDVDWLKAAFAAGLRAASLPTPSPQ